MPRHPRKLKGLRLAARLGRMVRTLGLGEAAPSVENAGKRLRHVHAAMQRLATHRA
jgi:hypothetical protein